MEYQPNEGFRFPRYHYRLENMISRIEQMAFSFRSVFSFFRADASLGAIDEVGLVSPESWVYTSPTILSIVNGLFSLYRYGLRSCQRGFGAGQGTCIEGTFGDAYGKLSFTPMNYTAEDLVDELATLLTSGRLNSQSRKMIAGYVTTQQDETDDEAGFRLAQQLISATPEFHSTNLINFSGEARVIDDDPVSPETYKGKFLENLHIRKVFFYYLLNVFVSLHNSCSIYALVWRL